MECTVIIPIGPGHEALAEKALQSVILASQAGMGRFENIHVVMGDDTKGQRGRSATRNALITGDPGAFTFSTAPQTETPDTTRSEWLFFLDADDLMCSPAVYGESAFEVVAPYLENYDCVWGTIHEVHSDHQILKRKQVDYMTKYEAYVKTPAMLSCQIGHFARRATFPGFDEDVDVCEDVRLYLQEWKHLRCIKQEKPLFLNRRGAHTWMANVESERKLSTGREWSMEADRLLKEARKEL